MPLFGPPDVDKLKARRDVKGLIKALHDRDYHVRNRAAAALGKIGDTRAVQPLLAAAEDPHLPVRRAAAEALGRIRSGA